MSNDRPIESPLETAPPRGLMDRKIIVRPGEVTTFRLMHDPKNTDHARWFAPGERNVRRGNEVTYLIRGEETYAAMAEAIKLTSEPLDEPDDNHKPVIYLLGWSCNLDIPLVAGKADSTLRKLLTHASSRGVEIRAILWANMKGLGGVREALTAPQVEFINSLPTGRAILDAKTVVLTTVQVPNGLGGPPFDIKVRRGSHHQKLLVTNGKRGLIAFCGGIDFSEDRLGPGGFQDVHCQIRGPAAHDLLVLFANRWDDYLNTLDPDPLEHDPLTPRLRPGPLDKLGRPDHSRDFLSAGRIPAPGAVFGEQVVQTGRTTPKGLYHRFRLQGEQSARKMILKGIESARSFIYMEDQYLLNVECADALASAAAKPSMRHVTIVIPPDNAIDAEFLGLASFHRAEFVKRLDASPGSKKIQIFCSDRYVHSKMYIFDDEYAIIGSANCNRRGWEHDSEVVVGVFDESKENAPTLHFAKRLRMKLWADHLNLHAPPPTPDERPPIAPLRPSNTQAEYVELADGVASAVHWRKRPARARIRPYYPDNHNGKSAQQVLEESVRAMLADGIKDDKNPTSRAMKLHIFTNVQGFLKASGLLVESRIWNEVLDPPSPL